MSSPAGVCTPPTTTPSPTTTPQPTGTGAGEPTDGPTAEPTATGRAQPCSEGLEVLAGREGAARDPVNERFHARRSMIGAEPHMVGRAFIAERQRHRAMDGE